MRGSLPGQLLSVLQVPGLDQKAALAVIGLGWVSWLFHHLPVGPGPSHQGPASCHDGSLYSHGAAGWLPSHHARRQQTQAESMVWVEARRQVLARVCLRALCVQQPYQDISLGCVVAVMWHTCATGSWHMALPGEAFLERCLHKPTCLLCYWEGATMAHPLCVEVSTWRGAAQGLKSSCHGHREELGMGVFCDTCWVFHMCRYLAHGCFGAPCANGHPITSAEGIRSH